MVSFFLYFLQANFILLYFWKRFLYFLQFHSIIFCVKMAMPIRIPSIRSFLRSRTSAKFTIIFFKPSFPLAASFLDMMEQLLTERETKTCWQHVTRTSASVSISRRLATSRRNLIANVAVLKLLVEITIFAEQKHVPFFINELYDIDIQSFKKKKKLL